MRLGGGRGAAGTRGCCCCLLTPVQMRRNSHKQLGSSLSPSRRSRLWLAARMYPARCLARGLAEAENFSPIGEAVTGPLARERDRDVNSFGAAEESHLVLSHHCYNRELNEPLWGNIWALIRRRFNHLVNVRVTKLFSKHANCERARFHLNQSPRSFILICFPYINTWWN